MSGRVYTSGASKNSRKQPTEQGEQPSERRYHTDPAGATAATQHHHPYNTTATTQRLAVGPAPATASAYVVPAKRRYATTAPSTTATPAAQKAVAKARRRRWREATAPLTSDDYDRVRENLESSSSCDDELTRGVEQSAPSHEAGSGVVPAVPATATRVDDPTTTPLGRRTAAAAEDGLHDVDASPTMATAIIHVGSYVRAGAKGSGGATAIADDGDDTAATTSSPPPRVVVLNPMSLSPIRSLSPRAQKHRMVLDDHTHFYRVYSPPPADVEEGNLVHEGGDDGGPMIANLADRPQGGMERPAPPTSRPPALRGADAAMAVAPSSPPASPSAPPSAVVRSPVVATVPPNTSYVVASGVAKKKQPGASSGGSSIEEPPLPLTPQRNNGTLISAVGALHYDAASPTHSTMMAASRCDSDADMRGDADGWTSSFAPVCALPVGPRTHGSPNVGAARWGKSGGVDTGSDLVGGGSGGDDASCWSPNHLSPLLQPPKFQLLGDDEASVMPSSPLRHEQQQHASPKRRSPGSPTLVGVGVSPAHLRGDPLPPAMTARAGHRVEAIEVEPSAEDDGGAQQQHNSASPPPSQPQLAPLHARPLLAYVTTTLEDDEEGSATPASGIDYVENSPSHFRGVSHSMSSVYGESEEVQEELRAIREVDKSMQDAADAEQMLLAEAMVQSVPPKGSPSVPVVSGSPPRPLPLPPLSSGAPPQLAASSPRLEAVPSAPAAPSLVAVDVVPLLPNDVVPPPPVASRPLPPDTASRTGRPLPNPLANRSSLDPDDAPVSADPLEEEEEGGGDRRRSDSWMSPQRPVAAPTQSAEQQQQPQSMSLSSARKSRPLPSVERLPIEEEPPLSPQPNRPMPTSSPLSSSPRRSRPLPAVAPLPADDLDGMEPKEKARAPVEASEAVDPSVYHLRQPLPPADDGVDTMLPSAAPADSTTDRNGTPAATTSTTAAPATAVPAVAAASTANKNLVRRAKVAHIGTGLQEYHRAIQAYLVQLKAVRNKLPQHANDAVRDVLAFATSFGRAAKALKASVDAAVAGGQQPRLNQPHAWVDHDLAESDDVVYTRLLELVADEVEQVEQQLRGVQEARSVAHAAEQLLDGADLAAVVDRERLANLGDAVRRIANGGGNAADRAAVADAVANVVTAAASGMLGDAATQLDQLCRRCRHAEVFVSLLCDLQRIYPCGFIPHDRATSTMLNAIVQRLVQRHAADVEQRSAFASLEGVHQMMHARAAEGEEVGEAPRKQAVAKACTDRVWALRDIIVDYDETAAFSLQASPPRAARTPLAGRFPFVSSVTSQVHHLRADSDEATLVKTCADSHQYCAASQDRLNDLRRNSEYQSLLDATVDASAQLMACVDTYAVQLEGFVASASAAEWMARTLQHHQDSLVSSLAETVGQQSKDEIASGTSRFAPFQHHRDPPPHAQLKAVALRVLREEMHIADNRIGVLQPFIARRRRMRALLQEEIDMVRTLVQVPLALDPDVLLWQGTDDVSDALFKEPTKNADERAAVLDDVVASNRAVAKANFLLIGNGLVSSGKASASDAFSEAKQRECLDALHAVHNAQEVVAAALRRMQFAKEQRQRQLLAKRGGGAERALSRPSDGSSASSSPPSLPQPTTATAVSLFGPHGPTTSQSKATTLIHKMVALQSPGIIAFIPGAIRRRNGAATATTVPRPGEVARCTLRLSRDAASLEFAALREVAGGGPVDEGIAEGGDDDDLFEPVPPISFGTIEMILQGPTVPMGVASLQCAKFIADTEAAAVGAGAVVDREVYFPSFASFMEWSEVLQLLLKARHCLPSAELLQHLARNL